MSSLFTLLDDIVVLAKAAAASVDDIVTGAAKASVKAAGVAIDDAAVTPQYVRGISPKRELPIVWRITRGSLLNKAIIIVAVMLLSLWAPWVFPWLLLAGGSYLAFEGTEKVWHWWQLSRGLAHSPDTAAVLDRNAVDERKVVSGAVRTDLVLSTEIMLIALSNIDTESWGMRLGMLIVVAIIMTVAVYGSVGLLVKMDDLGLWIAQRPSKIAQWCGSALVKAMPTVFRVLSIVGVVAMLWVGGHILLVNLAEVGFAAPYDIAHTLTAPVEHLPVLAWFVESALSAVLGLIWGAVILMAISLFARLRPRAKPGAHTEAA